jgi:hypothetical protein
LPASVRPLGATRIQMMMQPRQFSVLFTVMWTRCGRGPEPVRPHDEGSAMIDTVRGCLTGA